MGWEQRLRDLVLAASAVTAGGCAATDNVGNAADAEQVEDGFDPGTVIPCCNANPDPCCGCSPDGPQDPAACGAKMACEASGGTWADLPINSPVGPPSPMCAYPQEAGSTDASSARDASQAHEAGPGDASSADVFDAGDASGADAAD
jgi:hypothetical protein